ncbi:MAG: hypothetical protein ACKKMO_02715 [Candidatus Nealsonbacteria bacterium]
MRNKIKYLALVIIISGLVFPKPTLAFIGTGVFDYFETALSGIEEVVNPIITKLFFQFLMLYIIGVGALYTSAYLLQTVIENPGWLSLSGNTMVKSGWDIISGLSNMFFILVFIIIALAIILKIESFEAKKLLPKLLIVALLVNFSLVFVGILVDVSNIFYKTILIESNEGLPLKVINSLGAGGYNIILSIMGQFVLLAVSFIVPFLSPFAQLAVVLLVMGVGFLPNILTWTFQIICFFMMSGILFTYAFLFAARIYIVQLLAMLAPLAFLCSVLPQTQKYWEEWLKTIVEWIFLGIILFLFLVLGLRATDSLVPSDLLIASSPFLGWITIPEYLIYYFFLFVYLSATLWLSKKYMPDLAEAMIKQGKSWGGMIWSKGLKPIGKGIAIGARKAGAEAGIRERVGGRIGGRLAGWGAKQKKRGAMGLEELKDKKGTGAWFRRRGRRLQRRVGLGTAIRGRKMEAEAVKERRRISEEYKEMIPEDQQLQMEKVRKPERKVALAAESAREGKLGKMDEKTQKEIIKDSEKLAKNVDYKDDVKDIVKSLGDKVTPKLLVNLEKEEDQEKMKDEINKRINAIKEKFSDGEIRTEATLKYKIAENEVTPEIKDEFIRNSAASSIVFEKATGGDIKKMNKNSLKTFGARIGSHDWGQGQWKSLIRNFDDSTVKNVMDEKGGINDVIKSRGDLEKYYEEHPRSGHYLATGPIEWAGKEHMEDIDKFEKRMKFLGKLSEEERNFYLEEEIKKEKEKRERTQLNKFLEDLDYSKEEKRKFFESLEKKDRKKALEDIKKELEKLAFKEKGEEGVKALRKSWKAHEEIIKSNKEKEKK